MKDMCGIEIISPFQGSRLQSDFGNQDVILIYTMQPLRGMGAMR